VAKRKYVVALVVCLIALVLDQAAKTIVEYNLSVGYPIHVVPGLLEFKYAQNTGMAFGLLQNLPPAWQQPFFSVITLVAVAIIVHLLRQAPARSLRFPIALGLILSGAFGNLIDRFRWHYVVDFIHVYYWPPKLDWPIFNLADTFITIGIVLLIFDTIFAKEEQDEESEARPEDQAGPQPETRTLAANPAGAIDPIEPVSPAPAGPAVSGEETT
jgi:signal peptidase II